MSQHPATTFPTTHGTNYPRLLLLQPPQLTRFNVAFATPPQPKPTAQRFDAVVAAPSQPTHNRRKTHTQNHPRTGTHPENPSYQPQIHCLTTQPSCTCNTCRCVLCAMAYGQSPCKAPCPLTPTLPDALTLRLQAPCTNRPVPVRCLASMTQSPSAKPDTHKRTALGTNLPTAQATDTPRLRTQHQSRTSACQHLVHKSPQHEMAATCCVLHPSGGPAASTPLIRMAWFTLAGKLSCGLSGSSRCLRA